MVVAVMGRIYPEMHQAVGLAQIDWHEVLELLMMGAAAAAAAAAAAVGLVSPWMVLLDLLPV